MIKDSIKVGAVALLTFSFFIPNAHAQEITTEGNASMEITAERSSYYTVAVPETLSIGQADSVDFQVQVKGNLAPKEQLKVTVDKDVVMKRENDSTYTGTGTATLDDAVFDESNLSDSYVSQTGNIVFNETKAGNYTGTISFKVAVEKTEDPVINKYKMKENDGHSFSFLNKYQNDATSVSFDRGIPDLAGKEYTDVSAAQDGTVIAYLDDTATLHIASDGIIELSGNYSFMFANFIKVKSYNTNGNVDGSRAIDIQSMFRKNSELESIDLGSFNFKDFQLVNNTFEDCVKLKSITWGDIDFSNAWNFSAIFYNCENLTTTLNIRTPIKGLNYAGMFIGAATQPNTEIIVNYTAENESNIEAMITKKSDTSNVVKGTLLE